MSYKAVNGMVLGMCLTKFGVHGKHIQEQNHFAKPGKHGANVSKCMQKHPVYV